MINCSNQQLAYGSAYHLDTWRGRESLLTSEQFLHVVDGQPPIELERRAFCRLSMVINLLLIFQGILRTNFKRFTKSSRCFVTKPTSGSHQIRCTLESQIFYPKPRSMWFKNFLRLSATDLTKVSINLSQARFDPCFQSSRARRHFQILSLECSDLTPQHCQMPHWFAR